MILIYRRIAKRFSPNNSHAASFTVIFGRLILYTVRARASLSMAAVNTGVRTRKSSKFNVNKLPIGTRVT